MSALDQLRAAKYEQRTKTISLSGVAKAIGLDSFPVTVRALSADEINRAKTSKDKTKFLRDLTDAAQALQGRKAGDALSVIADITESDVQDATALSMAIVTMAIVDPEGWAQQDTVKLEENHAIEFQEVVNAAYEVTGMGNRAAGSVESGQADSAETP